MIFRSFARPASLLLSTLALQIHADLNLDDSCTAAQKSTLNAAFTTAQKVVDKAYIRIVAIDEDNLSASDMSQLEVARVNRLMTTFFAVGSADSTYKTALAGLERECSLHCG